jgi:small multidrug resistance family-3 protein
MTKAIAILNDFLMVAIASSFFCWLASLHPQALVLVRTIYIIFAVLWMLSWVLDDWLIARLKINLLNLQGILCLGFAAVALGLGVMICRS